jgi:hypothetical protein
MLIADCWINTADDWQASHFVSHPLFLLNFIPSGGGSRGGIVPEWIQTWTEGTSIRGCAFNKLIQSRPVCGFLTQSKQFKVAPLCAFNVVPLSAFGFLDPDLFGLDRLLRPSHTQSRCRRPEGQMTKNEEQVLAFAQVLGLNSSEVTACCNLTSQITKTILAFATQLQAFGDVRDARVAARLIAFAAMNTLDIVVTNALEGSPVAASTSSIGPTPPLLVHRVSFP